MSTTTTAPSPVIEGWGPSAEEQVRAFAAAYPTPNVLAAVAHCESGRLPWWKVRNLFTDALDLALEQEAAR